MRGVLAPLAVVLALTGCRTVEWRPGPLETWRGRSSWLAVPALVTASDEAAAAEAIDAIERVHTAFAGAGLQAPPPALLVVVDTGDEPLLGDAATTLEMVPAWHRRIAGDASDGATHVFSVGGGRSKVDLPPELLRQMATVAAGAVPLDAAELQLPAAWTGLAKWGVVLPTDACVVGAADAMLDFAVAREELSFGRRLALAALMPIVRGGARDELRKVVLRAVTEAALAAVAAAGAPPSPDAAARVMYELGLVDDVAQ